MTTAFQSNAFQNNAFQIDSSVVTRDTHDGVDDEDVRKRVKERVREDEKAFRSKRDRLREVIALAYDPEHGKQEVQAIAAPYVERLESGAPRIDYAALERNAKVMAEILAFQDELRAEFQERMDMENDEEDVMILASWN